jgi:uncharacterized protein YfaS (alpha-2-macroglobulin family)
MKMILNLFIAALAITFTIKAHAIYPSTPSEIMSLSKCYSKYYQALAQATEEAKTSEEAQAKVDLLKEKYSSAHSANMYNEYGVRRITELCASFGVELIIEQ